MQFHSVIVSQSGNNDSFDFILSYVTGLHGLGQPLEKLNIAFKLEIMEMIWYEYLGKMCLGT